MIHKRLLLRTKQTYLLAKRLVKAKRGEHRVDSRTFSLSWTTADRMNRRLVTLDSVQNFATAGEISLRRNRAASLSTNLLLMVRMSESLSKDERRIKAQHVRVIHKIKGTANIDDPQGITLEENLEKSDQKQTFVRGGRVFEGLAGRADQWPSSLLGLLFERKLKRVMWHICKETKPTVRDSLGQIWS